jgi:hypothetical protein
MAQSSWPGGRLSIRCWLGPQPCRTIVEWLIDPLPRHRVPHPRRSDPPPPPQSARTVMLFLPDAATTQHHRRRGARVSQRDIKADRGPSAHRRPAPTGNRPLSPEQLPRTLDHAVGPGGPWLLAQAPRQVVELGQGPVGPPDGYSYRHPSTRNGTGRRTSPLAQGARISLVRPKNLLPYGTNVRSINENVTLERR